VRAYYCYFPELGIPLTRARAFFSSISLMIFSFDWGFEELLLFYVTDERTWAIWFFFMASEIWWKSVFE
jgi:hypothetical protein